MSSHHIVRDEQEPALLIHQLDSFPISSLNGLLEWSPVVLCCQAALVTFNQLGTKLDIAVVGLNQQKKWSDSLRHQHPVKIVGISGEDYLGASFLLLEKTNQRNVNIVTSEEALWEVVQLLTNRTYPFEFVVFTEKGRYLFMTRINFKKWIPKNTVVRIHPLVPSAQLETKGFLMDFNDQISEVREGKAARDGEIHISLSPTPYVIEES